MVGELKFNRLIWVDYRGIVRTKVFPQKSAETIPKLANVAMSLTINGGYPANCTESCTGEVQMVGPDDDFPIIEFSSIHQYAIPWNPRHSFVFANFHEMNGKPWIHGPRQILQRAIDLLSEHGVTAQLGFELEFAVFDPKNDYKPWPYTDDMIYCSSQAFDIAAPLLDDIYDTLLEMGISVRMMHAENGPGQFEIVLQHTDVMTSVEHSVLAKEAVRAIARKHGKHATFAPVYGALCGNGGHFHLSLDGHFSTCDTCVMDGTKVIGIDDTAKSFIQGIVDGLPWVTFPVNASPLSYKRTKPGVWAGVYQVWGVNNKESPVRLSADGSNVEVKCGDCISNPFLGVAAVLTAGAVGLKQGLKLSDPCQIDPHHATKMNYRRLPTDLGDAISQFERICAINKDFATVFPPSVVNDFIAVRREELAKSDDELQSFVTRIF